MQENSLLVCRSKAETGVPHAPMSTETGLVRSIASIESALKLFTSLVNATGSSMSYLLMYKFSQGHPKLFFAANVEANNSTHLNSSKLATNIF